mgnify:CR=1 FL=1
MAATKVSAGVSNQAVSCDAGPRETRHDFCGPCVGKLLRRRKAELPVAAPAAVGE